MTNRAYTITYTVVQHTTARDLERVQRAFRRELQLTQGRLTEVTNVEIRPASIEEVQLWATGPDEEVKIDRG